MKLFTLIIPASLPDIGKISEIREPIADVHILVPSEYLGNVITLAMERRGVQKKLQYVGKQVSLEYQIPMNEIVLDFFDRLKSVSRGFASLDYNFNHFSSADLVKLDILINGERVDALTIDRASRTCFYPRQCFGGKIKRADSPANV